MQRRGQVTTILATVLCVVVALSAFLGIRRAERIPVKALATSILDITARAMEEGITRPAIAGERLAARIVNDPGMGRGTSSVIAADILSLAPWITGVSIAPHAVVKYHFPEGESKDLIGHDLLTNPARRAFLLAAVQKRATVLEPPSESIDGRSIAFVRTPVIMADGSFWGFVSISFDFAYFMRDHLGSAGAAGFDLSILRQSSDPAIAPALIWGEDRVLGGSAVKASIRLPGDDVWTLAALPRTGWNRTDPFAYALLALAVAAILLAALLALRGRAPGRNAAPASPESGWELEAERAAKELSYFSTGLEKGIERLEAESESFPALQPRIAPIAKELRAEMEPFIALASELSEYAEARAGRMVPRRKEFETAALIAGVQASCAPVLEAKGLGLNVVTPPKMPPVLKGDLPRLQRVLRLLVLEAAASADRGDVLLRVVPLKSKGRHIPLKILVADQGPSPATDRIAAVFDPFTSARGPLSSRKGLSGMGMAAARAMLAAMGAEIRILESPIDYEFGIELIIPLELPRSQGFDPSPELAFETSPGRDPSESAEAKNSPAPTAVAESEPPSAVETAGAASAAAGDAAAGSVEGAAASAAAVAQAVEAGIAPDVEVDSVAVPVAAPVEKPVMTPASATAEQPRTPEDPPADQADEPSQPEIGDFENFRFWLRTHATGISFKGSAVPGSLFLPDSGAEIEPDTVRIEVPPAGIPTPETPEPAPEAAPEPVPEVAPSIPAAPAIPAILLVDDSATTRNIVTRMLDSRGYRCDSVDSGEAAVAAALAKKYDLILMDCLMPGMDGFAAARMIRSSAEEAGTRIVGMSSMIMQGEYERGVEAGMDGMIAKPITVADLLASVSKVVGD